MTRGRGGSARGSHVSAARRRVTRELAPQAAPRGPHLVEPDSQRRLLLRGCHFGAAGCSAAAHARGMGAACAIAAPQRRARCRPGRLWRPPRPALWTAAAGRHWHLRRCFSSRSRRLLLPRTLGCDVEEPRRPPTLVRAESRCCGTSFSAAQAEPELPGGVCFCWRPGMCGERRGVCSGRASWVPQGCRDARRRHPAVSGPPRCTRACAPPAVPCPPPPPGPHITRAAQQPPVALEWMSMASPSSMPRSAGVVVGQSVTGMRLPSNENLRQPAGSQALARGRRREATPRRAGNAGGSSPHCAPELFRVHLASPRPCCGSSTS